MSVAHRRQPLLFRALMRAEQSPKDKIERPDGLALGLSLVARHGDDQSFVESRKHIMPDRFYHRLRQHVSLGSRAESRLDHAKLCSSSICRQRTQPTIEGESISTMRLTLGSLANFIQARHPAFNASTPSAEPLAALIVS